MTCSLSKSSKTCYIDRPLKRLRKTDSRNRPRDVQLPLDADRGLSIKPTNGYAKSLSVDLQGNRSRYHAYTVVT